MKTYKCECGYQTTNRQAFCGHRGNCKIAHPNLKNKKYDYLKNRTWSQKTPAWNKGLTKDTDERVKRNAQSLKGKSHPQTEETKKKISQTMKKNPNSGGLRKNSGIGKSGWYKNIFCHSTYELVYVIYNLDHNIEFKPCDKIYEYYYKGIKHKYYPDFELPDGTIIEIKGYMTDQVKEKIKAVKDRPIKVLYKNDLKYAFDYVKANYKYKKLEDLYE